MPNYSWRCAFFEAGGEVGAVQRVQRVLIAHLSDQQPQEVVAQRQDVTVRVLHADRSRGDHPMRERQRELG